VIDALPLVLAGVGLMVGSFLNVCISRLPAGESIAWPGSRCPSCRTPIRWYDNIPVLSYILLGGRCRACRTHISIRYPLVEIATAGAFALVGATFPHDPLLLGSRILFAAMLVVLFGTDLETQRLPNLITLPGIVIGIAFSVWLPPGLRDSLIGAALGAVILWGIRWAWFRATGVEAMGLGDVKMLAMIGAFLGWRQVWVVLFLASIAGAFVGIAMSATRGQTLQAKLPFGTFLALAAFAAAIIGDRLLGWYLSLYR
jgi:leader peptidase (prepilin peptidase)/N-methyltransferase